MEACKHSFRNIQIIRTHSMPLLKIVVAVLIMFSMAALIALGWVRTSIRNQTEDMRSQAAALEQENQDLEQKIGELGSVKSVQDIAQEELGLVNPDTILIQPNSH